eukprot:TRINITY_DN310_c0_g1_i14.p1 TRINITY_DN310_c0_g1~~TRINITY_DN310_c0_g1_i14.p1  ORF type:complete len:128 (+),score=1.03 TRINITY_DN310_c0_g1_i14:215-598(+)
MHRHRSCRGREKHQPIDILFTSRHKVAAPKKVLTRVQGPRTTYTTRWLIQLDSSKWVEPEPKVAHTSKSLKILPQTNCTQTLKKLRYKNTPSTNTQKTKYLKTKLTEINCSQKGTYEQKQNLTILKQ